CYAPRAHCCLHSFPTRRSSDLSRPSSTSVASRISNATGTASSPNWVRKVSLVALSVEVVATDRTVWSGEASAISAPAADGSIGILPGHQPVLAVLRSGTVDITPTSGEKVELDVSGGFVSVDHDTVTIVIDASVGSEMSDE